MAYGYAVSNKKLNIGGRIMENYFPILMFVLVGVAIGVLPVAMGFMLAPSRPDPEKLSPYECGFEAFEDRKSTRLNSSHRL